MTDLFTKATTAEIRLADMIHVCASAVPYGPGLRPVDVDERGRFVYVSAIWDAVARDHDTLLWHAFANPAHWSTRDHDDGGYGLKAWLSRAARTHGEDGIPLVVLGSCRLTLILDSIAERRSRFTVSGATCHFLVDRTLGAEMYVSRALATARVRSSFTPPARSPGKPGAG